MSESLPGYRVDVAVLPDDAQAVIEVWSEALGYAGRRPAKLDWYYTRHPTARARLLVLRHGRSIVGATGLAPRRMVWRGEPVDAALMGDFAVHSRHRTLFPALTLQQAALRQGLAEHALLYGFPNAKSLPVVRRVGYRVLPGMARHARVLHSAGYLPKAWPEVLRRALGGAFDAMFALRDALTLGCVRGEVQTAWLDSPDERFDALWQRALEHAGDCVIGVRDRAFMHWRFEARGWHGTRLFVLIESRTQRLLGYAACERDAATLHVRDLLVEQASPRLVARLLRLLARQARDQGQRSLSISCSGPEWLRAGLRAAGLRLRDASSQPMILALGPQAPPDMASACWYLTRADIDE